MTSLPQTPEDVREALKQVKDPEIPVLSLVDLGVITRIEIPESDSVQVEMTPTFSGCPALEVMRRQTEECLHEMGFEKVSVEVNFKESWNSNKISEGGRQKLREFGLSPAKPYEGELELEEALQNAECPSCGSRHTSMQTPFGPTLCRSIHYCHHCRQAFEQFKPV
jgi:ring-1,2-phenylacetyl-CoA epoxidase subunit PaaD